MTVFAHSQTIPPGLAGKIIDYHLLSEPIRLQDLEDLPTNLGLWPWFSNPPVDNTLCRPWLLKFTSPEQSGQSYSLFQQLQHLLLTQHNYVTCPLDISIITIIKKKYLASLSTA